MQAQPYRSDLETIFRAGLERVDPYAIIAKHVSLEDGALVVDHGDEPLLMPLADVDRILVLGMGKGSAPMAMAMEDILGGRVSDGAVIVKYGHGPRDEEGADMELERIQILEAGHPVPDAAGEQAAAQLAELAQSADERTLVLGCISGGGSALSPLPAQGLSLRDKQEVTDLLLASGADIGQINCVRKHLSRLKGGGLLRLLHPARSINFILSDVIGDDLGTIASGSTTADPTTYADALAVLDRYGLRDAAPAAVLKILENGAAGDLPETVKPSDPVLEQCANVLVGTNRLALLAAADAAVRLGYAPVCLTSRLSGEARHAAGVLADVARDCLDSDMLTAKPACLLWGGETTVTLKGTGEGGRNQELALAFLQRMAAWEPEAAARISLLSAGTDGTDGPTNAAGAFADGVALRAARAGGLDMAAHLEANNSHAFHQTAGSLFVTGPTRTNVCDLQVVLVEGTSEERQAMRQQCCNFSE